MRVASGTKKFSKTDAQQRKKGYFVMKGPNFMPDGTYSGTGNMVP